MSDNGYRKPTMDEKEAMLEHLDRCEPEAWKALIRFCLPELVKRAEANRRDHDFSKVDFSKVTDASDSEIDKVFDFIS